MRRPLIVKYLFHPVGQGLFASGHLEICHPNGKSSSFSWVYDCGTTSSQKFIDAGLAHLSQTIGGPRPAIDLVIISHFDIDHISGIVKLLGIFPVRTLIIPLTPLWQRLSVLFDSTQYVEKSIIPFYLDPVAAISGINGARIEKIVLIPPSEGEGPPVQRSMDNDAPFPPGAGGDDINGDEGARIALTLPPGASEFAGDNESSGTYANTKVYKIAPGESLSCVGLFEFVPYNDACLINPRSAAFVAAASANSKALLGATSNYLRNDALRALKRQYEAEFKDSYERNAISLYIYAGPIRKGAAILSARHRRYEAGFEYKYDFPMRWCRGASHWEAVLKSAHTEHNIGANILYTGDGFLKTPDSWNRLASYLGLTRTVPLLVFQVMHHGSSANWRKTLARDVGARIAIFSSDPDHRRFKHPHDSVVDDFASCGEVAMVNKTVGFAFICAVV